MRSVEQNLESMSTVHKAISHGCSLDEALARLSTVETVRQADSDEDLALAIESDCAVLVAVDAGVLRNDARSYCHGEYNSVAWAWGIERDPQTGRIAAVLTSLLDSEEPQPLPASQFLSAWLPCGGWMAEVR